MPSISPDTWAELRRFVREQGPMHDEPDADDMGGPSDNDADNAPSHDTGPGAAPGAALVVDMKPSQAEGQQKVCPTCGHPM